MSSAILSYWNTRTFVKCRSHLVLSNIKTFHVYIYIGCSNRMMNMFSRES